MTSLHSTRPDEALQGRAENVQRWTTITDPAAAAWLCDPCRAVFLYPFIGRERAAAEVAKAYGVALNTLGYRIKRMQALGLLTSTRQQAREGRPVRYYRAVADAFFVPMNEHTPTNTLEKMVDHWSQALQPLFLKNFTAALNQRPGLWGVRISREGDGRLMIAPAQQPEYFYDYFNQEAPSIIEGWLTDLRLDDADAKDFQRDLLKLYLKYMGREGRRRYLLRVALTPLLKGELPAAW
jgi:hypothetical protein